MRKTEILHATVNDTVLSFTFRRLTVKQETFYREWVQQTIMAETREMLKSFSSVMQIEVLAKQCTALSAGPCSLTGDVGATRVGMGPGLTKFMFLAAADDQPDLTGEAMSELVMDNFERCVEIVKSLHPMSKLLAEQDAKSDPKS